MTKILIIGSFSDYGGREIEAGFIASSLKTAYDVEVLSTGLFTNKSHIYEYDVNLKATYLYKEVAKKSLLIKLSALISSIRNNQLKSWEKFVSNRIAKKILKFDHHTNEVIKSHIIKSDLVFICAQLSSSYLQYIIDTAKLHSKKVIFRTTGTISDINYNYIDKVDLFIHHSISNSLKLSNYPFKIIDQTTLIDDKLLGIPILKHKVTNFMFIGRVTSEKGLEDILKWIAPYLGRIKITIIGDGDLKDGLVDKYHKFNQIKFIGAISNHQVPEYLKQAECLIIGSPFEAGPIVGIEAMAAGRIILSTRVGAMPERLNGSLNDFWYEYGNPRSFIYQLERILQLSPTDTCKISTENRLKYLSDYSISIIKNKYLQTVVSLLN
jgi:glycosyltransferase involved in cell wall biosynthesis